MAALNRSRRIYSVPRGSREINIAYSILHCAIKSIGTVVSLIHRLAARRFSMTS